MEVGGTTPCDISTQHAHGSLYIFHVSGNLPDDLTQVVNLAAKGDRDAAARVWDAMYEDLRDTARRVLGPAPAGAAERPGPTTVVHEVFLKVFRHASAPPTFENRRHFFGSMARAMGQFLVDYRRHHRREKRGGLVRTIPLGLDVESLARLDEALIATDHGLMRALEKLETVHPLAAEVVWLRFVAGLSLTQTASALGIASRTVTKHWNFARAFIRRAMDQPDAGETES
jgi:RNA polymerase sigma factor (TIGR02999 family)